MPEPTVAVRVVLGLMEYLTARGASRRKLLEISRLGPAALKSREKHIPLEDYVSLMRAGKELCQDPALALHFGEEVDLSEMSILPMIGNSPGATMAENIARLNRYVLLDIDVDGVAGDRFLLERIEGEVWFVDARRAPNDFPEITESMFARIVCGMRRWIGETQLVKAVHVTHAAPEYRAEYDRIFRLPVAFESDQNALLLSEEVWSTARASLPAGYATDVLREHADTLLEKMESSKTTKGRVEGLLLPILHTSEASIETIADKLGLSRQTLFRRLKAEGATFENVLDQLRHKMALYYLGERNLSVTETAYRVGFSDPAAFSRAFKRWTGSSPRGMRRPS